jgi:hypothetical protein
VAPFLVLASTALLLLGCGNGTRQASQPTGARLLAELRYAAGQATLTCGAGQVEKWNANALRRECVKQTPAAAWDLVNRLLARCPGGIEVIIGDRHAKWPHSRTVALKWRGTIMRLRACEQ